MYHKERLSLKEQTRFLGRIRDSFNLKMSNTRTRMDLEHPLDTAAVLDRCHYTLQYTYAYGYYLEPGHKKDFVGYSQVFIIFTPLKPVYSIYS